MRDAYISGVGCTRFGRHEGAGPVELMAAATEEALADAGIHRLAVDGLICGYATTLPHLMLSDVLAEKLALKPHYAHGVQLGGATGGAMLMLAADLVRAGRCERVLVLGGENRLTGQSRDQSIQTLSQIGDPEFEVPWSVAVPSYYALLGSHYLSRTGATEADLAEFAVLMRNHAGLHPLAHLRNPLTVDDVLQSKPISLPLKLLDCCPISDGAAALLIEADPAGMRVRVRGAGQAHQHQHLTAMSSLLNTGAGASVARALEEAAMALEDIDYLSIYDSFTITLAMLLEEIGIAPAGKSASLARDGMFGPSGPQPLNLHGGLLSFGHSGVAAGLAHAVEAVQQLRGAAHDRQAMNSPLTALVHSEGGVLSAHVSLVLERTR